MSCSRGEAVVVRLYLPSDPFVETYYKYGRTSLVPVSHWYDFRYDGTTGAEINGNVLTLHFVDGGRGDSILNKTLLKEDQEK